MYNDNLENFSEFDSHTALLHLQDAGSGLKAFVAIHRGGIKEPAFGATRIWRYGSENDAVRDALRLSRLMSYKSALAGLQNGGAKAVMMQPTPKSRNKCLCAYAKRLNYLSGRFITGTDVGLSPEDLKLMRRYTRNLVGFKTDPTRFTAMGVFVAIRVALQEAFGSDSVENRSFAVQGLGKIGFELIRLVTRAGGRVTAADVSRKKIAFARKAFPKIKIVSVKRIFKERADVYSPCALSSAINAENLASLRCRIIAGGANNQLDSFETARALHEKNILYVPDYAANAGGLISVVGEYYGKTQGSIIGQVEEIGARLESIFRLSRAEDCSPEQVANRLAERMIGKFQ
jgi:leucine dehydrogenase